MKKGDFVKVSFTGEVDRKVIDTTDEAVAKKEGIFNKDRTYKPIPVVVGESMILAGIDKAVEELIVGQEKKVKISPKDGFGERNAALTRLVPMREFKKQGITPIPGLVFEVEGRPARIQSVSGGRVRVDFNHPLAGKESEYKVKVEEVAKTEKDKINYLLEKSFNDDSLKSNVEGTGEKKRLIVEIPEKLRANKALIAMKAGFFSDATKHLEFKEVEFKEVWVKK